MNLPPFQPEPILDFTQAHNQKKILDALEQVTQQMGREYPLIIGGEDVYSGDTFESRNPSQPDEVIGIFHKARPEDVEQALNAAWKAYSSWARLPHEERAAVLFRAAHLLRQRRFEMNAWLILEAGKNWAEADGETAELIDYFEFYGREMLRYGATQPLTPYPGEAVSFLYEPLGAGVIIPPWNFPAAILGGMSSAAVVTGNTILLKPSSDTPAIGYQYVRLMEDAGVPPGVINFIPGPGSTMGDLLVSHPRTRFIAFTGSMKVGTRINELAARTSPGQIWIKRVIAEMGGKDAIIVDRDYPHLADAARWVAVSAFGYQGQKCSACSRLILDEEIYEPFLDLLVSVTEKLDIGPARDNHAIGPVINQSALEKILEYMDIGRKEGRLLTGGGRARPSGFFLQPTIFADVNPEARIAQEEIFGPVLSVIRYRDFTEALHIANNTIYGLTGSVFTLNREKIAQAKREFHCGNLYINRKCTGAIVGVHPFGGFNMSGTDSKAGGRDYLLLFLQGKSIAENLTR